MRALLALCVLIQLACQTRPHWTSEERENFANFTDASQANRAALQLLNRGTAFSGISANEMAEYLRLQKKALESTQRLRDEVLTKAHPELPTHLRSDFQRSLELDIRSVETNDNLAGIEAAQLHDRWVDWYNQHRHEIKIPK